MKMTLWTRIFDTAIPKTFFFRPRAVESILSCAMPFYHCVYSPGELQFITGGLAWRQMGVYSQRPEGQKVYS